MLNFAAVQAQTTLTTVKSTVEPLRLSISANKTTNLIFPYGVISIDRGDKDLLVQKAKGVENILQIKAASDTLPETNLSVVTADGGFYSFITRYAKEPSLLTVNLSSSGLAAPRFGILQVNNDNQAVIRNVADAIAVRKPFLKRPGDKKGNVVVVLQGLYIKNDMFFWQLAIDNATNVRYDIEQFRFFIRDRKKAKRTASQEVELDHAYVLGNTKSIPPRSRQVVVFAFPKFTIPDGKYLTVQLMEERGGRHLSFKIPNRTLLKAKEF